MTDLPEISGPDGYRIVSAEDVEQRYAASADVSYPFLDFADEQEIRLYRGGLHVAGSLTAEPDTDWNPYNVVVDGDLTIDGDLRWWDWSEGNFLLITGDLRARNVFLSGCPNVVVRGDLLVANGIQGDRGEDGGRLTVRGRTRARIVVSTLYFNMSFAGPPEAVVAADPHRINCPVDFTDDELAEVVRPDLLDADGDVDENRITDALAAGAPILRPGVTPSHMQALAELDALLGRADTVTAIDLSDRKLRAFPEQLYAFPNLRTLSLAGNDGIRRIPKRIAELTHLRELDLSGMRLKKLPRAIGRLAGLEVLTISGNRLRRLPEEIGDLGRLRVLRVQNLRCPLPESLTRLGALEELDLSSGKPPVDGHFLDVVSRLGRLRALDLTMTALRSVPDELAGLASLEALRLSGALGRVDRLPDLSRLPRLRLLHMAGSRGNTGSYPDPGLLDRVWTIATLEELAIDRWGGQPGRPALTRLPDDAFDRMPGLRVLDLSFNELTVLPGSFYRLAHLETVDLRYTDLDRAAVDRVRATFPRVRVDLRNIPALDDPTDPAWQAVRGLVTQGSAALGRDRAEALALFEEALARCVSGTPYAAHDHLYALYGAVDALSHLVPAAPPADRPALAERLVGYAEQALALVPDAIWHFTDEGAFQEEVLRRTGNSLAWELMQRGDLERALAVVDRALNVAPGPEYDFIRDTKVRILLAAGRREDAYLIVDRVLSRNPDFADFADLRPAAGT